MHSDAHGNCFVTLTYRDKSECDAKQLRKGYYVPDDLSLDVTHFQKFLKRCRKHFEQRIRYFHCGEYGDQNLRPHYHACMFNVSFGDRIVYKNDNGFTVYSSPTLEKLWPYGFSTVAELNFQTAAYTAGYCLKKVTGARAADHYLRSDSDGVAVWVKPEYVTMSLKPGIGAKWYEKFSKDVFPSDEVPVPGKGIVRKVPRYYETILESSDPGTHQLVKQLRQSFIANHKADFTPQMLMSKYKVAKAKEKMKRREL